MSVSVQIGGFWRVGRRVDPLLVLPEFQGRGRFDDPEHLVAVIYGAPERRTCLMELLRSWPEAPAAAAILNNIPKPQLPEDAPDADRDRAIAASSKRRPVPPFIYEHDIVYAAATGPLTLLDLTDVTTQQQFEGDVGVAREMMCYGYAQFDRGTLLAPVQHRRLTQAVTNAVLRGVFAGQSFDGMQADGRHGGEVYAVFSGPGYNPQLRSVPDLRQPLTPDHPELRAVATNLGLDVT